MTTLDRAIAIAAQAHQGQKDKSGVPYILHPIRMMVRMGSEIEMIAAVLHDVVEDSDWTLERLHEEGFSAEVLDVVDHLTHRESETYEAFVARAASHPIARKIKLADLEDNMDIRRLNDLSDKQVQRLRKYHRAWRDLQ
jgi:(p)ppGpp synthase/HD superfamily hydrolase